MEIYIITFAIIVASVIIYFSQRSEKLEKQVNVQEKEIVTENKPIVDNPIVDKPIVDKPIVDVHEIILRNGEYIPKINGKYLHTDYPSYKFYLDKSFEYCKRYSTEKEAIKAIKDYYIYKDVNHIVHETDLKNCDIVCFPISNMFYPRVNKRYINSASFNLYKTYDFENETIYSIYFYTKKEALKFLETYNNSLGVNDIIIKVDINL